MDRKEYMREYRLKKKEKLNEKNKAYLKTPEGIKSRKKTDWKKSGLIGDLDAVYDIYLATTECMRCSVPISGMNKHMDHCHNTGEYRAVLCRSCNVGNILDTKPQKDNKNQLNEKWIYPHRKRFKFQKTTKKIPHREYFDTLEEAIAYKTEYLASRMKSSPPS